MVKELFMADVQQNSRPCAYLHCGYTIEPIFRSELLPADRVIDAVMARLAITKGMNIHQSTDTMTIVSFPDHREALWAMKLDETQELLLIDSCSYRF
jgi:hypothetical protein